MSPVTRVLTVALLLVAQSGRKTWTFDAEMEGKLPAGFSVARTGQGADGQWVVKRDESAPSRPNVLAQTSPDKTDYRFPLAIVEGASYKDVAVAVKFKAVSGSVDQGAGLVFRLQDKDNYYVVRANALENNLRLYHVVKGQRVQFAGANFKVTPMAWHEMRVEARGNQIKCFFEGQLKITATDETFKTAGKVGLWTKADSVIYFDDVSVEDLGMAAPAAPSATTLAQRLVDDLAKAHPELVRVGVHVTPPDKRDNVIIASNVTAKIGQKSDPEDLEVMKTRRPVVLREGDNYDVTLPLHDATGQLIGALGLTLKPNGTSQNKIVQAAQVITAGLERLIPSKAALFRPDSRLPVN